MIKYRPRFSAACTFSQYIIAVQWDLGFGIRLAARASWRLFVEA